MHKAMLIQMRPHIVMAVKSNIKTIWGHLRPYKSNTAIQYHNVPQKHIFFPLHNFCSTWTIFYSCFHAKKNKNNNNNNALLVPLSVACGQKSKFLQHFFIKSIMDHCAKKQMLYRILQTCILAKNRQGIYCTCWFADCTRTKTKVHFQCYQMYFSRQKYHSFFWPFCKASVLICKASPGNSEIALSKHLAIGSTCLYSHFAYERFHYYHGCKSLFLHPEWNSDVKESLFLVFFVRPKLAIFSQSW